MGTYTLKAGASIDVLTPKEHAEEMEKTRKVIRDGLGANVIRGMQQITSDAAGNVGGGINGNGVLLYETPLGYRAGLHRVSIAAPSPYTPVNPVNQGWLGWYKGGPSMASLVMFTPSSGTAVVPFVWSEGNHSAPVFTSGETLVLVGSGLPANLQMGISYQLTLYEVI